MNTLFTIRYIHDKNEEWYFKNEWRPTKHARLNPWVRQDLATQRALAFLKPGSFEPVLYLEQLLMGAS
jgi:hypothetical protein